MLPRKKLEADLERAVRTLQQAGYTDHGGEYWKPPLGKPWDIQLADAFYQVAAHLNNNAQRAAEVSKFLAEYADSICEGGIARRQPSKEATEAMLARARLAQGKSESHD